MKILVIDVGGTHVKVHRPGEHIEKPYGFETAPFSASHAFSGENAITI